MFTLRVHKFYFPGSSKFFMQLLKTKLLKWYNFLVDSDLGDYFFTRYI